MKIIFMTPADYAGPIPENNISISTPTAEWLLTHTVDELAKFIVPEGAKYKIIEDSDIPNDRSFRDAWEIDESELSDGIGEP